MPFNKIVTTRLCRYCQKVFTPKHENNLYCSSKCKHEMDKLDIVIMNPKIYNPFYDKQTTLKDEFRKSKEYKA